MTTEFTYAGANGLGSSNALTIPGPGNGLQSGGKIVLIANYYWL